MIWLYIDTKDVEKVSNLATSIFWLVIPSLSLFIVLPLLLKKALNFYLSMGIAISVTVICYYVMISVLSKLGLRL